MSGQQAAAAGIGIVCLVVVIGLIIGATVQCSDGQGRFAGSESDNGFCSRCVPGYSRKTDVKLNPYTSVCATCSCGTYSEVGAASCSRCGAGKYSGSQQSYCYDCRAGSYSSGGICSCDACSAGSYSLSGASDCTQCSPGRYSSSSYSSSCLPCAPGTAAGSPGATACYLCGNGTYAGGGATSCDSCPAGSFASLGASGCTSCPGGKYQDQTGQGECKACPEGSFCQPGASAPRLCPKGGYAPSPGSAVCQPCGVGRYNSLEGQNTSTACLRCPLRTYCSMQYLALPRPCVFPERCLGGSTCVEGYSGDLCSSCASGWFADHGSATCVPCPPISRLVWVIPVALLLLALVASPRPLAGSAMLLPAVGAAVKSLALLARLNIPWPSWLRLLLQLPFLLGLQLEVVGPECLASSWTYSYKYLGTWLLVLVVYLALLAVLLARRWAPKVVLASQPPGAPPRPQHPCITTLTAYSASAALLPILYLRAVESLVCSGASSEGLTFLIADPAVVCQSMQHQHMAGASAFLLIAGPVAHAHLAAVQVKRLRLGATALHTALGKCSEEEERYDEVLSASVLLLDAFKATGSVVVAAFTLTVAAWTSPAWGAGTKMVLDCLMCACELRLTTGDTPLLGALRQSSRFQLALPLPWREPLTIPYLRVAQTSWLAIISSDLLAAVIATQLPDSAASLACGILLTMATLPVFVLFAVVSTAGYYKAVTQRRCL